MKNTEIERVPGVIRESNPPRWIARWNDPETGESRSASFNVSKYGEQEAHDLAAEAKRSQFKVKRERKERVFWSDEEWEALANKMIELRVAHPEKSLPQLAKEAQTEVIDRERWRPLASNASLAPAIVLIKRLDRVQRKKFDIMKAELERVEQEREAAKREPTEEELQKFERGEIPLDPTNLAAQAEETLRAAEAKVQEVMAAFNKPDPLSAIQQIPLPKLAAYVAAQFVEKGVERWLNDLAQAELTREHELSALIDQNPPKPQGFQSTVKDKTLAELIQGEPEPEEPGPEPTPMPTPVKPTSPTREFMEEHYRKPRVMLIGPLPYQIAEIRRKLGGKFLSEFNLTWRDKEKSVHSTDLQGYDLIVLWTKFINHGIDDAAKLANRPIYRHRTGFNELVDELRIRVSELIEKNKLFDPHK